MYSKQIMDRFYNITNAEEMRAANGSGKATSGVGNEIIKIFLKVEKDKVTNATFQTFGGVVAIALSSFAAEWAVGKTLSQIGTFTTADLIKISGEIPPESETVAGLVVSALKKAAENCNKKG